MGKRLGSGLGALFGEKEKNQITSLPIENIKRAPWQPRKEFDEDALKELASSIMIYGVLQPILVRKDEDQYEIIAGERRWRASKMANISEIPCMIVDFTNKESLEASLIENIQRKDLNPIEKAESFSFLIEKLNINQEELAKRLGISRSYISNFLRIRNLSSEIKDEIAKGSISMGHAKVLINRDDAEEIAKEIVEKKISVRQIESRLSAKKNTSAAADLVVSEEEDEPSEKQNSATSEKQRFEEMINKAVSARCEIEIHNNKGEIKIKFENIAELERIITKICIG